MPLPADLGLGRTARLRAPPSPSRRSLCTGTERAEAGRLKWKRAEPGVRLYSPEIKWVQEAQ